MEKIVTVLCTVIVFLVFFAALGGLDFDAPVRAIFAALFAAGFGYIFFRPTKNNSKD